MQNNNREVISRLAARSMKTSRQRNLFAMAAIILTTILFTVTFTISAGLFQSYEDEIKREVGTDAHAGFKYLTEEQYNTLKKDSRMKAYSYNIFLGTASNKELVKRSVELRYAQDKDFQWSPYKLEKGTLPCKKYDIVLDTLTLDALGLPYEIGENVTLCYDLAGVECTDTFILSGYYNGDILAAASETYLSKEYVEDALSVRTSEEWAEDRDETNGVGLINMDFYLGSSFNVEKQVEKIIEENGYQLGEIYYGINWAYSFSRLSSDNISSLAAIGVLIIMFGIAGYLMIYNVFYISIVNDVKLYGLLKTIGMTKKQIGKLIRKQADRLCVIAIPAGLLLGWLMGNGFLPLMTGVLNERFQGEFSANPFIFLFSMVFSFLTVHVSLRKPGKLAAGISPIEAAKYEEVKKKRRTRKRKKPAGNFSYFHMAVENLKRNQKKNFIVILSLSLGLLLFLEIFTVVSGFSTDKFVESMLCGDVYLSSANMQVNYRATDVSEEIKEADTYFETEKDQRIQESLVYAAETQYNLSQETFQKYKQIIPSIHNYYDFDVNQFLTDGGENMNMIAYGFDWPLVEKLEVTAGTMDQSKFETGNYIILADEEEKTLCNLSGQLYKPGDHMTILGKDYEVMALAKIPNCISYMSYAINAVNGIFLSGELQKRFPNVIEYGALYRVDSDYQEQFEAEVAAYTVNENPSMVYDSKKVIKSQFESLEKAIVWIGGTLSAVLGCIAVMNLVNTLITSIIARKREFAALRSIGMEKGQLIRMLITEGLLYVAGSYVSTSILGSLFSLELIRPAFGNMTWCNYHFTLLPILACLPVLLLVVILIPVFLIRKQKETVVELLRME